MSQHAASKTTQAPPSDFQAEISQLQCYINHVRQAILTAPDDYTQMIRTWVLALAEAELARLVEAVEKKVKISKSEVYPTWTTPDPPSASSPPLLQPENSLNRLSSPVLSNSTV